MSYSMFIFTVLFSVIGNHRKIRCAEIDAEGEKSNNFCTKNIIDMV